MPAHQRSAFTLIELLVVIAIIAILSVVVVLTLNPAAILQQSRDQNRLSDMTTLTDAISQFQTDQAITSGSGSLGSANTVYISLPDPGLSGTGTSTCSSLGLPLLPTGYTYQCASPQSYRTTGGKGWIPVNFQAITTGSPLGQLPIDPVNASSSRLYYTYTTNGSQFEVTSVMESAKYGLGGSNDVISPDGGTLASVYEKGSKLGLEPLDYGDPSLVGLWTFQEGSGSVAYDYSGNNATGSWQGGQAGTNGFYSAGKVGPWAGAFDGSSTYVGVADPNNFDFSNTTFTVTGWFRTTNTSGSVRQTIISKFPVSGGWFVGMYAGCGSGNNTSLIYFQKDSGNGCDNARNSTISVDDGNWHNFVVVVTTNTTNGPAENVSVYIDGALNEGSLTGTGNPYDPATGQPMTIGEDNNLYFFQGLVDDVRIYNRALSAAQIAAMYSGGK